MPRELRFDPFRVLTEAEREAHLHRYREFLGTRDGQPDLTARTLAVREPRMSEIEQRPVAWEGALDRSAFERFLSGDKRGPFDARTELVLAAALANESEAYGVDIELRRFARNNTLPGLRSADLLLTVYVEEAYHCRILAALCRTCGVEFEPRRPGALLRSLVWVIGALPGAMRWVPVMAGETVATAVFRLLHARADLFEAHPEVRDRVQQLLRDIWIDEVGHVAFLRAQLGRLGLLASRALLPVVARTVLHQLPPLPHLGIDAGRILAALRDGIEVPPEMSWLAEADDSVDVREGVHALRT